MELSGRLRTLPMAEGAGLADAEGNGFRGGADWNGGLGCSARRDWKPGAGTTHAEGQRRISGGGAAALGEGAGRTFTLSHPEWIASEESVCISAGAHSRTSCSWAALRCRRRQFHAAVY